MWRCSRSFTVTGSRCISASTGRRWWIIPTINQVNRCFERTATTSSTDSGNKREINRSTVSTLSAAADQTPKIVDAHPMQKSNPHKVSPRLPMVTSLQEFPPDRSEALRKHQATFRILRIAADRLVEPPTLHLLILSAWATMGIASLEAILMCQQWPLLESIDAAKFVCWYSVEQLVPSIVWDSQDPVWIVQSLDMNPKIILRELTPGDPAAATALLRIHFLSTTRFFVAGFMMIASIVRAAGVSASAFSLYEERIRLGREPPLPITDQESPGIVIRMCGRDSYTTEVSMQKMGVHIFPVFENPERVQYLVWRHSEKLHRPVYWCVREGKYGSAYSWDRFPVDPFMFVPVKNPMTTQDTVETNVDTENRDPRPKLLILEADATNPHDPLALGNAALDLNLDDASQGFRRIQERFTLAHPPASPDQPKAFRTLRVYLGNSMEISRTGGGHAYTLRHRVRYAKEIDVLLDSRAPVLEQILDWCRRVATTDRRIFFQTSSKEYFQSLQKILKCYGYEIYDPLDLRALWFHQTSMSRKHSATTSVSSGNTNGNNERALSSQSPSKPTPEDFITDTAPDTHKQVPPSLLGILMEDPLLYDMWQERGGLSDMVNAWGFSTPHNEMNLQSDNTSNGNQHQKHHQQRKSEMLRQVVKMAKLPRLVHMPTTAETVNAVEALITAGEVDTTQCCAILEKQEGVAALEYIIQQKSDMVRGERYQEWIQETTTSTSNDSTKSTIRQDRNYDNENQQQKQKQTSRWTESRRHRAGGGAGLQMICTSTIYDDLFRQVRIWARMGFSSAQIQKEMDLRFHEILDYSHEAQQDTLLEEAINHINHDSTFNKTEVLEEETNMNDMDLVSQDAISKKTSSGSAVDLRP